MLKPLEDWDEQYLLSLIGTSEGVDLDFKQEGSVSKSYPNRSQEMCKDVSSFANAAGGNIIYGMAETRNAGRQSIGVASALLGCDPSFITVDEIHQILNSGIEARLEGVKVRAVPMSGGRIVMGVEIPQATAFAPHQVRAECIYYRRHGSETLKMFDHEIRDVMKRASSPQLYGRVEFGRPTSTAEEMKVRVQLFVGNASPSPSAYTVVNVTVETGVTSGLASLTGWTFRFPDSNPPLTVSTKKLDASNPIFFELEECVYDDLLTLNPQKATMFGFRLRCPGFDLDQLGVIQIANGRPIWHHVEGLAYSTKR